jgi:hypothetical protein
MQKLSETLSELPVVPSPKEQKRQEDLKRCVQLSLNVQNRDGSILNRELDNVVGVLEPLKRREKVFDKVLGFITAEDDAALVQKYITQVEQAVADYQVSFRRHIVSITTEHASAIPHERHTPHHLGPTSTLKLYCIILSVLIATSLNL